MGLDCTNVQRRGGRYTGFSNYLRFWTGTGKQVLEKLQYRYIEISDMLSGYTDKHRLLTITFQLPRVAS